MTHLITTWGYWAVALCVLAESGGVPLPGETAVIVAGAYAGHSHHLSLGGVFVSATIAAVVGGELGYVLGRVGGLRLVRRFGHKVRIDEAKLRVGRYLFDLHGPKVVFFGRFVSILRTYAAVLAGTNQMRLVPFAAANAAGAVVWAGAFSIASFIAGGTVQRASGAITWGLVASAVAIFSGALLLSRRHLRDLTTKAAIAYAPETGELVGVDALPAASSRTTASTPPPGAESSQTEPPQARTS